MLSAHYARGFSVARRLALLLTIPRFLPSTGPLAMRSAFLMNIAVRVMGNLVTDEDEDWIARVWRSAGAGSRRLDQRPPFSCILAQQGHRATLSRRGWQLQHCVVASKRKPDQDSGASPDRRRLIAAAVVSPRSPVQPLRPQFSTATTRAAAKVAPATSATRSMSVVSEYRFLMKSVITAANEDCPTRRGLAMRSALINSVRAVAAWRTTSRSYGKLATLARTASNTDSEGGRCANASESHSTCVS